jgi:hypothetical protein
VRESVVYLLELARVPGFLRRWHLIALSAAKPQRKQDVWHTMVLIAVLTASVSQRKRLDQLETWAPTGGDGGGTREGRVMIST